MVQSPYTTVSASCGVMTTPPSPPNVRNPVPSGKAGSDGFAGLGKSEGAAGCGVGAGPPDPACGTAVAGAVVCLAADAEDRARALEWVTTTAPTTTTASTTDSDIASSSVPNERRDERCAERRREPPTCPPRRGRRSGADSKPGETSPSGSVGIGTG